MDVAENSTKVFVAVPPYSTVSDAAHSFPPQARRGGPASYTQSSDEHGFRARFAGRTRFFAGLSVCCG
jgi:hypothetical protein